MNRTRCLPLLSLVLATVLLTACSHRDGTTYQPGETGTAMRVEPARVVSSREVTISGLNEREAGWGALIGAGIAGSAAYGLSGADNPAGVAITVVAAIVGGLAGIAAEEARQTRRGAEYIVEHEDGERIAIVQSLGRSERIFPRGTRVSLLAGRRGFHRVAPAG